MKIKHNFIAKSVLLLGCITLFGCSEKAGLDIVNEQLDATQSINEQAIATQTNGTIVQINVVQGEYVKQGAVIARIGDKQKCAALRKAQSDYKQFVDTYEYYLQISEQENLSEKQKENMRKCLMSAKFEVEKAKKELEQTYIVAPFSGIVSSIVAESGAQITTGTIVATIVENPFPSTQSTYAYVEKNSATN